MALENYFERKHPDSFHGSIQPLLLFAQICGLLPVKGIFGATREGGHFIVFTWANGVHVYAFVMFLVTLFLDTCYTIDNFNNNIRIDAFASTVFYTVCLITTISFLKMAKEFPEICKIFAETETKMAEYGYPKGLGIKIKIFLFSFIFLALVEHGALVVINVNFAWTFSEPGKFGSLFYYSHFPAITKRLPYSGLGTLLLFWVNVMCTFNWNYLDFFIIIMSMEIYTRFSQINALINQKNIQKESREFWAKISQDYNQVSILTKTLDKKLSNVILISFFSNIYHISLQLTRCLTVEGNLFQVFYFYCSLSYLAVRLLLVLFFTSKVNDESRKPSTPLLELEEPCPEAIRFLHQVLTDDVALTGNRFFIINKKFCLSIIGTILTYQGVLLQFSSLNENTNF